jgi:hypothetical protein
MMNYLPMIPNFYSFTSQQSSSYTPNVHSQEFQPFSNVLLINAISQALDISLKNYEHQLITNMPAT